MSLATIGIEDRSALALADERVEYDWDELDGLLNRASNGLHALPVGENRRAAVFAPNSAETAIAYVACLEAGVSSVPGSSSADVSSRPT